MEPAQPLPPASPLVRYAVPLMVAMNVIWGASYLAADIGMRELGVSGLASWRFLIAIICLFPLLAATRTPYRLGRGDILPVTAIGLIAVAGSYALTYRGIQLASATDRAVFSPLEPVILAVLGFGFLGERLLPRQWAGIALSCAGAYLLVGRSALTGGGWQPDRLLGAVLILLSFVTEGMYSIIGKPLLGRYRPLALTTWAMTIATVAFFAFNAAQGNVPVPHSARAWGAILFLALPCSVVGYTLWYTLLEHMPAGVLGNFIFIQPVVGMSLGVLVQGERVTAPLVAGALLVGTGVWVTGRAATVHAEDEPEPSA
jgi:drug/metabolite transporter (DMT)-like permease